MCNINWIFVCFAWSVQMILTSSLYIWSIMVFFVDWRIICVMSVGLWIIGTIAILINFHFCGLRSLLSKEGMRWQPEQLTGLPDLNDVLPEETADEIQITQNAPEWAATISYWQILLVLVNFNANIPTFWFSLVQYCHDLVHFGVLRQFD